MPQDSSDFNAEEMVHSGEPTRWLLVLELSIIPEREIQRKSPMEGSAREVVSWIHLLPLPSGLHELLTLGQTSVRSWGRSVPASTRLSICERVKVGTIQMAV